MDKFNHLSANQYRLGLIEDFFREEELDQFRVYLASLYENEQNKENEQNPDRQAKYIVDGPSANI